MERCDSGEDILQSLPIELGCHVFKFLSLRDLGNVARVCSYWKMVCDDELLWKHFCKKITDLSEADLNQIKSENYSWKQLCIIQATNFRGSTLINGPQRLQILKWLRDDPIGETGGVWELLFKGSVHGFRATDFHNRCLNVGPTVSVCLSEKGNLFGGYNSQPWAFASTNSHRAFIFSLINPWGLPCRILPGFGAKSTCSTTTSYGPLWGTGYDLGILGHPSNKIKTAWCRLGATYQLPCLPAKTGGSAHFFLDGAPRDFSIVDVEVFKKKKI
jgi:hypothetical protein